MPSSSKTAAADWPPRLLQAPRLGQCVTLALLLHILVVLMIGTAPGGIARPGEGVWGALNVTLRGATNAPGSGVPIPPATGNKPADRAKQARVQPSAQPRKQAPKPALAPALTPALEPAQAPATTSATLPATPIETLPDLARPAPDLSALPKLAPAVDQIKPVTPLAMPAPDPAHAPEASAAPAPPPTPAPVPTTAPVSTPAAAPSTTTTVPSRSLPTEQTPVGAPERSTATTPTLSAAPLPSASDAGSRLGHEVAAQPSASASAPRRPLDLSLPRGGALSSQSGRGLLQLMAPPPLTKSKLTEGMEKAARADCRQAYGGAGLLAVIPLAVDAARDKGCRW